MTPAGRQRRRRERLRKEQLKLGRKAERERKRLKAAKSYIPSPPGVTYWVKVRVGDQEIMQPTTLPLPSMRWRELSNEDLLSLLEQVCQEIERRQDADTPAPEAAPLPSPEIRAMAKGNNAQGKDRKKAKGGPKKGAKGTPAKPAAPKK